MNVEIRSCIQGAKEARGIAIIIDVLRATSTIVTILANGSEYVYPVRSPREALILKNKIPNSILSADNDELRKMGHYDNSPNIFLNMDLKDRSVILTTVNGTRGIVNAKKAKEIWVASFLNAKAIVDEIKKYQNMKVTLVPMGEIDEKSMDDELCARFIKESLENKNPDFSRMKKEIEKTNIYQYLVKTGRKQDADFCLRLNHYNIVPKVSKINRNIILKI
jgi:2-phosphosulfolactate phosphatase